MGYIGIEGMRFYAYHGFYDEEQVVGNDYTVDVYIETDFGAAAQTDDLAGTINYETVFAIVRQEMTIKSRLLETIAERILARLKAQFGNIIHVKIRIAKLNPPLGGKVDRVYIEIERNHLNKCPATGAMFLCYKDNNCWCKDLPIYPETLSTLKRQYGGACLSMGAYLPHLRKK